VENTSSLWPVSVESTSIKESVTLLEKEVIVNQLLLLCLSHALESIIFSTKFSSEFRKNS